MALSLRSYSATCSSVRLADILIRMYGFFVGYVFGQMVVFRFGKLGHKRAAKDMIPINVSTLTNHSKCIKLKVL